MIWPRLQPLTPERAAQLVKSPARQRLLNQIIHAETREEIDAAQQARYAWLVENPDDFGVLEAGEDLAYAEEALTGEEPAPVGLARGEHPPDRCPKCTAPAGRFTHAQHLPVD